MFAKSLHGKIIQGYVKRLNIIDKKINGYLNLAIALSTVLYPRVLILSYWDPRNTVQYINCIMTQKTR